MTHVHTQPLQEIESERIFTAAEESFVCCHRYHVTGVILMTVQPRYREGASCSLALAVLSAHTHTYIKHSEFNDIALCVCTVLTNCPV